MPESQASIGESECQGDEHPEVFSQFFKNLRIVAMKDSLLSVIGERLELFQQNLKKDSISMEEIEKCYRSCSDDLHTVADNLTQILTISEDYLLMDIQKASRSVLKTNKFEGKKLTQQDYKKVTALLTKGTFMMKLMANLPSVTQIQKNEPTEEQNEERGLKQATESDTGTLREVLSANVDSNHEIRSGEMSADFQQDPNLAKRAECNENEERDNSIVPANSTVQAEVLSEQAVLEKDEKLMEKDVVGDGSNDGIEEYSKEDSGVDGGCTEGSDVPKSISESGSDDFAANSHNKAAKRAKIGKKGGDIELYGYKISFPYDALKEDIEFEVSIDSNPANYPKDRFPITSILDVEPSMHFEKAVTVTMRTWFSATRGKRLDAQILQRSGDGEWIEDQRVDLFDKNEVKFDVWHFSGRVAVAGERKRRRKQTPMKAGENDGLEGDESGSDLEGDIHLFNSVHMLKPTRIIVSTFSKEMQSLKDVRQHFKEHEMVLIPPAEFHGNKNSRFFVEIDCIKPHGVKFDGQGEGFEAAFIGKDVLLQHTHSLYFDPTDFPPEHGAVFKARYYVKEKDVAEHETVRLRPMLSGGLHSNSTAPEGVKVDIHQEYNSKKETNAINSADNGGTLITKGHGTSTVLKFDRGGGRS